MSSRSIARRPASPLVRRFRHLVGVPSFHCDPVFGRLVHEIFATGPPAAVALEVPPEMASELTWAATCWPVPVVSIAGGRAGRDGAITVPFVPGDSILEAFRLASAHDVPVSFVDESVCVTRRELAGRGCRLPGAELADRSGREYADVADGLVVGDPVGPADLAREAAMARALCGLLQQFASVLWVGGLAHWSRIEARLRASDFSAPPVRRRRSPRWRRGRLAASALHRLTGQSPWRVRSFAAAPLAFDPQDSVWRLLHESGETDRADVNRPAEHCTAVDRARVGLYARNLAATAAMRDDPELSELLLAARDVVGPRYAARVYRLAMAEQTTRWTEALDPLTFESRAERSVAGYRFRGRWISLEPWRLTERPILSIPDAVEVERAARDAIYASLAPSGTDEKFYWGAYPPDQAEYEAFVEYVLRRASHADPGDVRVVPFTNGLADGLDLRTMIRFWHEDRAYVREEQRGSLNIWNGVIDWTSRTEDSDLLQRRPDGGWNDPDSPQVGSVSREFDHQVLAELGEAQVTLRTRQWSAISLDCPTFLDHPAGRKTFYDSVISKLVDIQGRRAHDHLYGWLAIVFRYAAGKPFVYYSRYLPSPRVFGLAREHDVRLVWRPLRRIPPALLERHRTWRQLWLSERQWEGLGERLAGARAPRTTI